jgi:hypothetical protein
MSKWIRKPGSKFRIRTQAGNKGPQKKEKKEENFEELVVLSGGLEAS